MSAKETTSKTDSLEQAEAAKEAKSKSSESATEGFVGEDALDEAIGDKGSKGQDAKADATGEDDPLEKAEDKKAGV